jgi:5'-methylthioadenosine phosphorylase
MKVLSMSNNNIAIIGGSGVYSMFEDKTITKKEISTPFGNVEYMELDQESRKIFFLPRHGKSHSIPPHKINFKANIFSLFQLNVKKILATNAVGSLKKEIKPGEFIIIDQFIDIVSPPTTFFEGEFEAKINNNIKKGVVHTDMTNPYSESIRKSFEISLSHFPEEKFHPRGCYVMFKGPRFESSAEISMFKNFGDVVGMTGVPEVILARELEIEYGTINLVTNYAAGLQNEITHKEVIELFNKKISVIQKIINKTIEII